MHCSTYGGILFYLFIFLGYHVFIEYQRERFYESKVIKKHLIKEYSQKLSISEIRDLADR